MVWRGDFEPITDKMEAIPHDLWDPHYSDDRFFDTRDEGLTIFVDPSVELERGLGGDIARDLGYSYSDLIPNHVGHDAFYGIREEVTEELAREGVEARTAIFIEKVLQRVFGNERLWVGHIKAGVNRSNGFSYQTYGYRPQE